MPLMTTEEVLRNGPDAERDDSCAELLRLIDELHRDITPEQWAEIGAAAKAADVAGAVEMLERRDALEPCHCGCGARVILEPEQAGSATIAG